MGITQTVRRQMIMKIQKLFCPKTMKDYYQVSGAGPKRAVIVEHEVRFVALQEWVTLYQKQGDENGF